jgi:hypothetical protein
MTRRLITAVAVVMTFSAATALGLALPSADASLPNSFRTFPSCHVQRHRASDPDRSCSRTNHFGAGLVSRRFLNFRYRLCFRRPDGRHRCVRKTADQEGKPSTVALYLRKGRHPVGVWRLRWFQYWRGHGLIGRDHLRIRR